MKNQLFAFVTGALAVCAVSPLGAQNTCQPADEKSAHIIGALKQFMHPDNGAARDKVHLPVVPMGEIVLVTDASVCARAGQAGDSIVRVWIPTAPPPSNTTAPLYVVKVGTHYVVADWNAPSQHHYRPALIFGPLW